MLLSIQRFKKAASRRLAGCVASRKHRIKNAQPVVSFTFDDFPLSSLYIAGAILEQFNARGTYYTSLGLESKIAPTGPIFRPADLRLAVEKGHEIGCHTFDHYSAWNTPADMYLASTQKNLRQLSAVFPGLLVCSHSYPIDIPRLPTIRNMSRLFRACRAGGQKYNIGMLDLNQLSAFFIEQSRGVPESIYNIIQENALNGGWLIFATHDVCDNPTRYGCTPALFEQIVSWSQSSGSRILSVTAALDLFEVPSVSK